MEDATERLDVIVRFLAVLELYKQGVVDIVQMTNFGDLTVRRLVEGQAALDAVSIADWDEPGSSPVAADEQVDAVLADDDARGDDWEDDELVLDDTEIALDEDDAVAVVAEHVGVEHS